MKTLLVGFVLGVILILLNVSEYHVTQGQDFGEYRYFVPIEFDPVVRGQWNISSCLTDLLNCWEITKVDMLCQYGVYKPTICDFWRDSCTDDRGRLDDTYGGEFTLYESVCLPYHVSKAT